MSNEQTIENSSSGNMLKDLRSVYFIGIGGIGMSALARYFRSRELEVSGYDRTETTLTKQLEKEGIQIHYKDDPALLPKDIQLVVYTPAVPKDHKELNYFQKNGFKVVKRSDVLGAITSDSFNICVAGTHGKTTISTMIAHLLRHSGHGCNAFLGGISANYDTNFWSSQGGTCVVEADEYDRSFLKLHPDIAVISAMDADHLDIYGNEASVQEAFVEFGNRLKAAGLLISKFGLNKTNEIKAAQKWTYSLSNESANAFASDIRIDDGGYVFTVNLPDARIEKIRLNIGGMHNVENMVSAISVAHRLEIDGEKIREAVADFKGVKRRFEYIIPPVKKERGAYVYPVFIDDYAHHPEELKALLNSARSLFPQRKITVLFQPHLYSRTRDFADGFGKALSIADAVVLLPIYPARELPIEGVTSEIILEKITQEDKNLIPKESLILWMDKKLKNINKEFGEVFITAGAGDIDTLVQPLKKLIEKA
jgi:UDP-N-acetylmuramate--alanine ligase